MNFLTAAFPSSTDKSSGAYEYEVCRATGGIKNIWFGSEWKMW
jgi:hypothetical protein